MCALFLLSYNSYLQPEADGQCSIDLVHGTEVQLSHFVFEPFLVDGSYLFEKDDAVLCQTALIRLHLYVSWQMSFITLTGNGRRYHSGTVPVANVVLDYKYRPDTALFRTHNGTEIGIINISSDCIIFIYILLTQKPRAVNFPQLQKGQKNHEK